LVSGLTPWNVILFYFIFISYFSFDLEYWPQKLCATLWYSQRIHALNHNQHSAFDQMVYAAETQSDQWSCKVQVVDKPSGVKSHVRGTLQGSQGCGLGGAGEGSKGDWASLSSNPQ
jgi:hypothetical protein